MNDVSNTFSSGGWEFNKDVVDVFDDHVKKNVPNYELIQKIVVDLSDWLVPDESKIVDVGASTGTTARLISLKHPKRKISFYLYDIEQEMLDKAKDKNSNHLPYHKFSYLTTDLTKHEAQHKDADLTICLFTLQFIPVKDRDILLSNLAKSARSKTGKIIIAEKLEQETGLWQEIANEVTWDYKKEQGIEDSVIRAKARSLRGVLIPLKEKDLIEIIEINGWKNVLCLYKFHNWGIYTAEVANA